MKAIEILGREVDRDTLQHEGAPTLHIYDELQTLNFKRQKPPIRESQDKKPVTFYLYQ